MATTSMSQPEKFDFGTVFEGPAEENPFNAGKDKEPVWTEDELEREKAEAYASGLAAGQADALQGIEQRIADAVQAVMDRSQRMIEELETVQAGLENEAKHLAITAGTRIGSEMLAQMRRQEIEAIVSDALSLLSTQPHVVIRVHEDLLDGFKQRFEAIAQQGGFAGKLIILGEPDFDRSDCRVEWAEGGISRDAGALASQIDEIIARHMPAAGMAATEDPIKMTAAPDDTPPPATPPEPQGPAEPAIEAEPESPWEQPDAPVPDGPPASEHPAQAADAAQPQETTTTEASAGFPDGTAAAPQTEETEQ